MSSWLDAKPKNNAKDPRLSEQVDLVEFPKDEWIKMRLFGPVHSYAQGWVGIKTKTGKEINIPKICLDYNPITQQFDDNNCPYRANDIYLPQRYITNVIVRDLQDMKPKKRSEPAESETKQRKVVEYDSEFKAKLKKVGSKTWTPVRVWDMPAGVAELLASLAKINKVTKNGKSKVYDLSDPRYGVDILVMYSPDKKGKAWQVQKDERTKLTDEELKYLMYKLDVSAIAPKSLKEAKADFKQLEKIMFDPKADKDEDEDDDDDRKSKKKKSKNIIDEDDDEDDEPKKKKKRVVDEDDDKPAKKKTKSSKLKKKKKRVVDDDDDGLEDLD